jgi:hypothetical protein
MAHAGPSTDAPTSTTPEERAAIMRRLQDAAAAERHEEPAPAPPSVHEQRSRLIIFDAELGEAISRALAAVNAERATQTERPLSWNHFVVYGLIKSALAAFDAARAEYEASQRLVLSADEVRERRARR